MKKLTLIMVLLLVVALAFSSCANNNDNNADANGNDDNGYTLDLGGEDEFDPDAGFGGGDDTLILGNPDPELIELMNGLYEGIEDVPMTENWEITSDNFSRFVFIDYIEGSVGIASQAMINVIPHAVVLIRVPEGTNAAEVATQIEGAADPAQWICVEAEKLGVFSSGQYVVMAMTYEAVVDGIEANLSSVLG